MINVVNIYFEVILKLEVGIFKARTYISCDVLAWKKYFIYISVNHGKIGFLPNGLLQIAIKVSGTDLCASINHWHNLFHSILFWRLHTKMMHLVAGCVMEGSMVFCQKNIQKHPMGLHRVIQILYLTKLMSKIKYISANGLFIH